MKIEDVIEGLNRYIENERIVRDISVKGHIVLQKTITPNLTFKAYKSYEFILWFVDHTKKYRVLTVKHTAKSTDGQEEVIERELNINLSLAIFNWIGSNSYNQVLTGEYKGEEI